MKALRAAKLAELVEQVEMKFGGKVQRCVWSGGSPYTVNVLTIWSCSVSDMSLFNRGAGWTALTVSWKSLDQAGLRRGDGSRAHR